MLFNKWHNLCSPFQFPLFRVRQSVSISFILEMVNFHKGFHFHNIWIHFGDVYIRARKINLLSHKNANRKLSVHGVCVCMERAKEMNVLQNGNCIGMKREYSIRLTAEGKAHFSEHFKYRLYLFELFSENNFQQISFEHITFPFFPSYIEA